MSEFNETDELIPLLALAGPADSLWERGRSYGIPECCIAEFVSDVEHNQSPAKLRGLLTNAGGDYVPCARCRAEANSQAGANVEQEARGSEATHPNDQA